MDDMATFMPFAAAGLLFIGIIAVVGFFAFRTRSSPTDRLSQLVGGATDQGAGSGRQQAEAWRDSIEDKAKQSQAGSKIALELAKADLKLRVIEFIGLKLLSAAVGVMVGWFLSRGLGDDPSQTELAGAGLQIVGALIGGLALSFAPDFYVKYTAGARIKKFNDQLGDIITMMSNALRGGYSFLQTMQLVGREAPEPTATEFKRVVQEVGLGRTTEDALSNLLRRMPSEDLDLLITAVNIQMEVGGNLAQILDSIGHTIRERVRIKGEIQTKTAQGRLSGYVITFLPIGMGVYISAVNPTYMAPMFTFGFPPEDWCCLPVAGLTMMGIGYYVMMKVIDIEV